MEKEAGAKPPTGAVVATGGFGDALHQVGETAASATAARAEAAIKARYSLAMMRPRNIEQVRVNLLALCKDPEFADDARYDKPIGKDGIQGPSIRFAEAAIQAMGYIIVEQNITYDDERKRIICITVTDCQTGSSFSRETVIDKTVERKFLKDGQKPISTRVNSYGDKVHLIVGTEDDVTTKELAAASKSIRTCGLRLLPQSLIKACMDQCIASVTGEAQKNPAESRRKMIDAFNDVGVSPDDLVAYLGHALEKTTPAEVAGLKAVYTAIRDGESSWAQVMAMKRDGQTKDTKAPAAKAEAPPADLLGAITAASTMPDLVKLAVAVQKASADIQKAYQDRKQAIKDGQA
jgi:hypothetical protein